MINIGETVLSEDVTRELREAVDSRIEELKKVTKSMEKAKLDVGEPEGKIELLRTLNRLMNPQADWEAEEKGGARQHDLSEVDHWNEKTTRSASGVSEGIVFSARQVIEGDLAAAAEAFDVPADPDPVDGWGEGEEAVLQRIGARLMDEPTPEDEDPFEEEPAGMVITDPDAVPEEVNGPYFVRQVDDGLFQVRTDEEVRGTFGTREEANEQCQALNYSETSNAKTSEVETSLPSDEVERCDECFGRIEDGACTECGVVRDEQTATL